MNILVVTENLSPFTPDEPVGRAVGTLTAALAGLGHRVTACLPLRSQDAAERWSLARRLTPLAVEISGRTEALAVYTGKLPSGVEVRPLGHEAFLDGGASGATPPALAQGLLARGALAWAATEPTPHALLHGVGLAGALACWIARAAASPRVPSVLWLDGLERQGRCGKEWVERLGLGWEGFTPEGFEFYGDLSVLKAGLVAADRVVLPGPSAVVDALSPASGGGLEGLVASRSEAVVGLLPGLDFARWNPATDGALASRYDAELLAGKASCKADIQNRLGLPVRADVALVALLPPLEDLSAALAKMLDRLLRADLQLVAPRGLARPLEEAVDAALPRFPDRIARVELDDRAEHQLLGGADLAVLDAPSDLEARQLLAALRYGALPIGRRAGLGRDLVVDLTASLDSGVGFVVQGDDPLELLSTLRRALSAFGRRAGGGRPLQEVIRRAMGIPRAWEEAAKRLEGVYAEAFAAAAAEALAEPCADAG